MENSTEKKQSIMPAPSQELGDKLRMSAEKYYNPVVWQGMVNFAKMFMDGKAFPAGLDTEAKVLVVLQAGRELDLPPVRALSSFYIVKGKVSIYGESAIGVVLRDGHSVKWGKCDSTEASVTITRKDNGESMTGKFTIKQAEDRKLTTYADGRKNEFWNKYPENMLKFKAFGSIARFIVADSLNGMSIKEELEADMEIIDVKPEVSKTNAEKPNETSQPVAGEIIDSEDDDGKNLQDFINKDPEKKPEEIKDRTKADIIKDINKLCLDNGKDPKKILEHYKKQNWLLFKKEDLIKVEGSVKQTIEKEKDKPSDAEVYYIPEDETMEIVKKNMFTENHTEQMENLIKDVSEDKYQGKSSDRYKGIF